MLLAARSSPGGSGAVRHRCPATRSRLAAALGQVALYGLLMLAAGSVGVRAAPVVGRTRALALGLIALFGGYLIESYASLSPLIEALRPLSWYSWTAATGRWPA